MTDKVVVLTTCATREEARKIATALVEKRLAACVSLIPGVESVYRWKGALEQTEEIVLLIKSSRQLTREIESEISRLHSYEVPETIALQIVDGAESYLDWLGRELRSGNDTVD